MFTASAFNLRRILPSAVFDQLDSVLRQTVAAIAADPLIITEAVLADAHLSVGQVERFIIVISNQFSGLLLAETPAGQPERLQPTTENTTQIDHEPRGALYQVGLTFEPEAIRDFLNHLRISLRSDAIAVKTLHQAIEQLQPNDPQVQSEFTLRLAEVLAAALTVAIPAAENSCELVVAAALQQQVEQERMLNEVTTQIRQSMNLPDILQTAVKQGRQLLQADRVVVYEFNTTAIAAVANCSQGGQAADKPRAVYGQITYEALSASTLPSVLGMTEGFHCFPDGVNHQEKYNRRFIQAIADIEATFALSPCLLKLLRRVRARAKLIVPIMVENRPWGLLIAHQITPRQWQDSEKVFFQRIAEQLAIAIYQANLYTQLQQQKQMLEQRVAERTQELGEALLAAQSADRAKSEFLAAMSHELRTPLTCVIGMAETMLRAMGQKNGTYSLKPEKQGEYLKIIKKSGEHLLELINDILDVSQVEAGKTVLNVTQFSLSQLAHQCLQMFREKATASGVRLDLDLRLPSQDAEGQGMGDVFVADRRRVNQILLNLLSNAVKFTPPGGKVMLRVWMEDNTAIFQVEDTGIGIPPEQQPLLFQKFQQLDSTYHRKYEGTGLGLALTKQLIELHGGTIEVESNVGSGSTFTVRLPAQPAITRTEPEVKEFQPSASVLAITNADNDTETIYSLNSSGRIALVEDHEETAMLICDLLTAAGCQVVWMVNGTTAIKQIEVLRPVLVITDIQIPGMDGFEIIHHVRSNPSLRATKILAITARSFPEDRDRCLTEGANEYLSKPIQPYQLLDKVSALIGKEPKTPIT